MNYIKEDKEENLEKKKEKKNKEENVNCELCQVAHEEG